MSVSSGMQAPRTNIAGYKLRQSPNFTPQQMQLFQQLLGGLNRGGGLSGGVDYLSRLASGSEEGFEEAEAPARSAFQSSLGEIGSRFAGYGSGAIDSSGFQQATSGAARDFAENIGANRMKIRENAIDRLLGLSDRLMNQRPYENILQQKGSKFDTAGDVLSLISRFIPFFGR